MYEDLGLGWAGSIPAFLSLACVPLPFLFWKYGARIRAKCKFASEAAEFLAKIRESQAAATKANEGTAPPTPASNAVVSPEMTADDDEAETHDEEKVMPKDA